MTDQNGTKHIYVFDNLTRLTADQVATLGTGVDGLVRCIGMAYADLGRVTLITSYKDPAADGNVVNQVQRFYDANRFYLPAATLQDHAGVVAAGDPNVLYTYSLSQRDASGGDPNAIWIRPASVVYPNGRVVQYQYESDTNYSALGRVAGLADAPGGGRSEPRHLPVPGDNRDGIIGTVTICWLRGAMLAGRICLDSPEDGKW